MTMNRKTFERAQALLKADGWHHVLTAMSNDPTTTRFGMMFAKTGVTPVGEEFWLNKDTINGPLVTALDENHRATFDV